ncbi:MAG: DUF1499 domain-containing protein [Microcoleaceae cyanobacterium]
MSIREFVDRVFRATIAVLLFIVLSYCGTATPVAAANQPGFTLGTIFSFSGVRPDNLGVQDGHLNDCPNSPNCVSSQSEDAEHQVLPLDYTQSQEEALEKLEMVLETFDNAEILREDGDYLYAEFTIPVFGFVDDVEFYLDDEAKEVQIRSASRLGESDLGVNRKRVETIRALFNS